METTRRDLNVSESLALQVVASLGWLSFLGLPYGVLSVSQRFNASESLSGWIASGELLAVAVAAMLAAMSVSKRDKRTLTALGLIVAIIGSLGALFTSTLTLEIISRVIVGAGCGLITAATNAIPVLFKHAEKTYAKMLLSMSLVYAVLMYGAPWAMDHFGPQGFGIVELILFLALGLAVFWLPRGDTATTQQPQEGAASATVGLAPGVLAILVGIFLLFASQALTWAYAAAYAQVIQVDSDTVTLTFIATALAQIPAAFLAARVGERYGYRLPIAVGLGLLTLDYLGMYCVGLPSVFVISTVLFSAFAVFAFPYIQGLLAKLDLTGQGAAWGGGAMYLGAAAGPAIGGAFFEKLGFAGVGIACAALVVITFAFCLRCSARISAIGEVPLQSQV
jgi:predicted MFS family arabinose efflux permease